MMRGGGRRATMLPAQGGACRSTTKEAPMSAPSAPRSGPRAEARRTTAKREGHGWVTFSGCMLALVATMNLIYGIAAIDDAHVFAGNAEFVFSDLNTWGWIMVLAALVQGFAAFSIFRGGEMGRWIGVGAAGLNSIIQLLWLPAFPFLSLALFALDILVIYGLLAYGGRQAD
jgi:hypothetical protein